jgi:dTDP-4-dehydrorhamnose 3,5-epimerase
LKFEPCSVEGAWVIRPEPRTDERGHFARIYCARELAAQGLCSEISQINTGFSPRAGTLRGMHYQAAPHAEVKLARCVRGAAYDVVVDLRPDSPSYLRWFGIELSEDNGAMLYAPAGTAHGYLTLKPDTELVYLTSRAYAPHAVRGVRHDDPAFRIDWPTAVTLMSAADRQWPDFPTRPLKASP